MALRTKKSGAVILESIIAVTIIAIAVMGVINLFVASYNMSTNTTDLSFAYNVARDLLEQQRSKGFYAPLQGTSPNFYPYSDYTTTTYYASDGSGPFSTQGTNRYKVVLSVVSDKFTTTSSGTYVAEDALRKVTVTVSNVATGSTLYTTGTNLARAGI